MDSENMPVDPDLENETLVNGQAGLHLLAKMLGTFKRELEAEGFDEEEAFSLTERWMLESMDSARAEDDDEEEE